MKEIADRTGLMVEFELRMLRSALRLNVKKPSYVLSHAALLLTCFFVGYSFALAPEYFLLERYTQISTDAETLVYDMLATIFGLMLLYTALRGVFGQGLRAYVDRPDFDILALTPIDSRSIIMAKCTRNIVSRLSFVLPVFLVLAPISLKIRTQPILLAAALGSLTLYFEFLQVASFAVHSVRDAFCSKLSSRIRRYIKIAVAAFSAIALLSIVLNDYYFFAPWTTAFIEGFGVIWTSLPSSLTASLVTGFMLGRTEGSLSTILYVSGFLTVALAITYAASGPYHPEEFTPNQFPSRLKNPIGFRIGKFFEKRLNWKNPSFIVFSKDLQLALRGALIDFSVLNFTAMYAVSLASWYLLELVVPFQMIPDFEAKLGPLKAFIKELVIILALLPFIPSLTSFSRELGKIWLLKEFPLRNRTVAYGKFLFALTISAASLAPMVLVAGLAFNIPISEWIICVVLPWVLLIANSFGVLVGAYLPPYDLGSRVSLRSIVTFFIFLAIILAPFTLIASARDVVAQFLLIALLSLYCVALTTGFVRQAGKGFEKLELREVLPHEAGIHHTKSENQSKYKTRIPFKDEGKVTISSEDL